MTTTKESRGKLVTSYDGKCRGPRYGEVYTAPQGETGFIAGYRNYASAGLGLMGERRFEKLKDAQDYAVQCSDN